MATKSILKVIDVRDKHFGRKLVSALENAENARSKDVTISKSVKTLDKKSIREIFG